MPSSTFSSNDRLPRGSWGRSWCLSALTVLTFLAGFEITFRQLGHPQQVQDSQWHWMLERSRVRRLDSRQWVLLGSSKMQCDVDLDVLSALTGTPPVQLAESGSSCLPTLESLARDESFGGVVVCELLPGLLSNAAWTSDRDRQERFIRSYESRSADALLEARLRSEIQRRALFIQPQLGIWSLGQQLMNGKLREPLTRVTLPNRSIRIVFGGRQPQSESVQGYASQIDSATVSATIRRLRDCASAIRRRGGAVMFLRFPSSGDLLQMERGAFPRSEEWDQLALNVDAPCLHFADDSELREFICPDNSHLDARDTDRFTRILYDRVTKAISQNKTP